MDSILEKGDTDMNYRVMTHMVASYPDKTTSLAVARGLAAGGASYIEIQFPFSDPTADGPLIQEACDTALRNGFTLADGFSLVEHIVKETRVPVFIMSYAAPAVAYGLESYLTAVKASGAVGCIIPDLPVGYDEGLFGYAAELGLHAVPVIAPNVTDSRLREILSLGPRYLYTALRAGITGQDTVLTEELISFLEKLKNEDIKVFGGFGIRSIEQIEQLSPYLHASVVGSHLIAVLNRAIAGREDIETAMSSVF